MVRRLPWTHPHLKVSYSGAGKRSSDSVGIGEMGYGTPRGKRLMYNGGKGSYSSSSSSRRQSSGGWGGAGSTPSSQKKRLDGLFLEGNWYCNCEPRLQAAFRLTKKKGLNNGKYFYTCEVRKCNFFLWADDAANRADGVTMTLPPMPEDTSNAAKSSTTPVPAAALPTPAQTTPRQRSMGDYLSTQARQNAGRGGGGGGSSTAAMETPSRTAKRKRVLFDFDSDEDQEDDYGLGDVSSDEERQMNEAMERSAKKLRDAAPSTPSAQRATNDRLAATPSTVTRTLFPEARRRQHHQPGGEPTNDMSFSSATTASSATAAPSSSPPLAATPSQTEEAHLDPTDEVMALLRGGKVDDATARDVRAVLLRFAMKAKGVARGRDSVRAALKGKDERIAELQERVASLEGRNRKQREQISDFKAGIMDLYSKY